MDDRSVIKGSVLLRTETPADAFRDRYPLPISGNIKVPPAAPPDWDDAGARPTWVLGEDAGADIATSHQPDSGPSESGRQAQFTADSPR